MSSSESTLLDRAKAGDITEAMRAVAEAEYTTAEFVRSEVATGRIVIPMNKRRSLPRPVGIGRALRAKINVNIGASPVFSDLNAELGKLRCAVNAGADAVMDLSTGPNADSIRRHILAESPVPVGTVPIYQAAADIEDAADLKPDTLLETIEHQAAQGVDFMTLHAGLLKEHVPFAASRLLGIVSRGGALLARWMTAHHQENPLYTRFDDVLAICRAHDVTVSLGDGLRPGCLADASDRAQFAELHVISELVRRCRNAGVQVMVEGPGHVPLNEIEMNMKLADRLCDGAPFYVLGPVVTDCAPGYDHIVAAIGATLAAYHGASFLCCVTPSEHIRLPTCDDIHEGTVTFRIAAHAADIALKRPKVRERDDAISEARRRFDWEKQFALALDPARARKLFEEAKRTGSDVAQDYCSMCGPKYCAMRISSGLFSRK
jgi:phosphomethylpyrimidine synthase